MKSTGKTSVTTGVAPIIIYLAERDEVVTISGVGRWPKAATLEYMLDKYGEIPIGVARSCVPGRLFVIG